MHTATIVGKRIFIIGGFTSVGAPSNSTLIFDIGTYLTIQE